MIKIDTRESAYVRSRIKDLSVVPNIETFNGLFACITPISLNEPNAAGFYDPVLIRDTDSLINNFGDPRIDPEKYIDLYCLMQIINNGGTCYIAKVPDGTCGEYYFYMDKVSTVNNTSGSKLIGSGTTFTFTPENSEKYDVVSLQKISSGNITTLEKVESSPTGNQYSYTINGSGEITIILGTGITTETLSANLIRTDLVSKVTANSKLTSTMNISVKVSKAKPATLNKYIMEFSLTADEVELESFKLVKKENELTYSSIISNLNSYFGKYMSFDAEDIVDPDDSIISNLKSEYSIDSQPIIVGGLTTKTAPVFNVTVNSYAETLDQYKDRRYGGCIMADLTAKVTDGSILKPMSDDDRRDVLHLKLKEVAAERKNVTVLLSAPNPSNISDFEQIGQWACSLGDYDGLWEYGTPNTTEYKEQSFYLEMYAGWLNVKCNKIVNGSASSVTVKLVAPTGIVAENILRSYRERGIQYPVAGEFYGTLPENCSVINNPKTKADRDVLVQYHVNPIYDTGVQGVQIYGNETLNPGYTDLNAAHIARTLVRIRSLVDDYTETLKFSLNTSVLYDTWKNYVSTVILEPLKVGNGIASYTVAMGLDTTTPEEIANRMVRGQVNLVFYQSAEIFDLEFTVFSSATAFE